MTRDELQDWKRHPTTKEVLKTINETLESVEHQILTLSQTDPNELAMSYARLMGIRTGLVAILEIEAEEEEREDD